MKTTYCAKFFILVLLVLGLASYLASPFTADWVVAKVYPWGSIILKSLAITGITILPAIFFILAGAVSLWATRTERERKDSG